MAPTLSKVAELHIITGQMGSGKSTLAKKLKPHYDQVFCTDLGNISPTTGRWVPTEDEGEKAWMRAERRTAILDAHKAGKRVLLEGTPGGVVKLMGEHVAEAKHIFHLDVPPRVTKKRVEQRAIFRGSDAEEDLAKHQSVGKDMKKNLSTMHALSPITRFKNPDDVYHQLEKKAYIDAFADEIVKIAFKPPKPSLLARVGKWAKDQYNSVGAAAGRAIASQPVTTPIGTPNPPIVGTIKNLVRDKFPKSTKPPGKIRKALSKVTQHPVVRGALDTAEYVPEMIAMGKVAAVSPYQQKTQHTCSAACLKAVLEHYGENRLAEFEVSQTIGVRTKGGAETDQIAKAARDLGFQAFEYSFDSLDQAKTLLDQDIPIICDIQSFNHPGSGHYVVLVKIDEKGVHLMDPNTEGNQRVISHAEMDERWWDRRMKPPHEMMRRWGIIVLPSEEQS